MSQARIGPPDDAWDRFLLAQRGHLLQSSRWGRFKSRWGWEVRRVSVERSGSLVGGAQVLIRRLPVTGSLAYVPRGPVIDPSDEDAWRALTDMLLQVCREAGAVVLRLEPDWKDDLRTAAWLATHGLRPARTVQPRSTIVVSLSGSEDELLARMKPKWRYNIRLAERKGIEISTGDGNCLPAFTQLLRETSARDRFAVHQAEYYADAWHAFAPDHVCLLMAWLGDQPLAGLMVFAFGRRATYLYGASSGTERQRMPNHLLQWRAMHWARKQGCLEYDLWGIPDEVGVGLTPDDSPPAAASDRSFGGRSAGLWGVFRFKSGFGGHVERTIGAWDFVCRPAWYRLGKTMGRL